MTHGSAIHAAYDAARPSLAKQPFRCACYAPYASLFFNTNGDVIACCKNVYRLGNVAQDRLDDIWHGRQNLALRKALKQYNFNLGCQFCEWQINGGQFDQVHANGFDNLVVSGEEPEWPAMMEFTISNTCNLACIMCHGELSSTIRAQRENLPALPKAYGDQFFADLRKYLPHLKMASFFGGEPFLAQENYRIWDMMEEDGVRIPIMVTTNGTQWNAKVERVLNAFPTHVAMSMDGTTKATVESVRVNAHFETLIDHVGRFLDYVRQGKTTMSLTYCLMRQNWHEFGDYLRFGEERGLEVSINTVISPKDCSLYALPAQELLKVADAMDAQDQKHGYSALPRNGQRWRSAVATLRKNAQEQQVHDGVDDFEHAAKAMRDKVRPDHAGKAWELIRHGKFEDAVVESRKIPTTDARTYSASIVESHALRQLRRFDEAEAVLKRVIGRWPRLPDAHIQLAWLRFDQGRFAEALVVAKEAERLMTESGQLKEAPGLAYLTAQALYFQGRKEEALARLREIPQDHEVAFHAALSEAWLCRDLGRFDESEVAIARAQTIRPQEIGCLIERGWLRVLQRRIEDGLLDAERANELVAASQNKEHLASVCHLMSVLCQMGNRLPQAAEWASKLITERPGNAGFLVHRAHILANLGRRDEALADAREALAVAPDNAEARALLAPV